MLDEKFFDKFGVEFKPNEIIFCEFEPGNEFYFIVDGHVQIVKVINNREKTIDVLQKGDVFGEMAILEGEPRSATAIATEHAKLLKFHRNNFDALLEGNPQLAYKLLVIFSKRIYDAKRRLMILLLEEPQLKVMDTMIMLAEQDPKLDMQSQIALPVTSLQIASWAGMADADVQKELTHLARLGKIDMYGDKVVVHKIGEFQRVVSSKRRSMFS